jgi:hypothetical protein
MITPNQYINMMKKKMKLKKFEFVLGKSPHYAYNEKQNYLTIEHSGRVTCSGRLHQAAQRDASIQRQNLVATGNKRGRLGLVVYMKKYFGTVVEIVPKRDRNGRINPHICTVLGKKGQVLFDAFDEWFEPEIYGVARERERQPITTPDITRQSWDDLFEV